MPKVGTVFLSVVLVFGLGLLITSHLLPAQAQTTSAFNDGKCVIGWSTTYNNTQPNGGYLSATALQAQRPWATYKYFLPGQTYNGNNDITSANLSDVDLFIASNSQTNYNPGVLVSLPEASVIAIEEQVKRGMGLMMVGDNGTACGDDGANYTYQLHNGPWLRNLFSFSNQCMTVPAATGYATNNYSGNAAYNWLNGLPYDFVSAGARDPGWIGAVFNATPAYFTTMGMFFADQNGYEAGWDKTHPFAFYPPYANSYGSNGWMFLDGNHGAPSNALIQRQAFWDQFPDCAHAPTASPTLIPTPAATPIASPTPLPGICLNLTYTPSTPKYGDSVTFTCGPLTGATRYEFSYAVFNKTTNQQVTTGTITSATTGSNISQPLPVTQEGIYKVVCRACDQNSCTPFEPFQ